MRIPLRMLGGTWRWSQLWFRSRGPGVIMCLTEQLGVLCLSCRACGDAGGLLLLAVPDLPRSYPERLKHALTGAHVLLCAQLVASAQLRMTRPQIAPFSSPGCSC